MNNDSFVQPDKNYRRMVAAVVVFLVVAGLVAMGLLIRAMSGIDKLSEEELARLLARLKTLTVVASWIAWCSMIGSALWLFWLGSRISRSERFPPPGARVLRPTRVRTGRAARRIANIAFLSSVLLAAAATFGVWRFAELAQRVLETLGAA